MHYFLYDFGLAHFGSEPFNYNRCIRYHTHLLKQLATRTVAQSLFGNMSCIWLSINVGVRSQSVGNMYRIDLHPRVGYAPI